MSAALFLAGALTLAPAPEVQAESPTSEADAKPTKAERRKRFVEAAPMDMVSSGAPKGDWGIELSGGYPWSRLRGEYGIGKGFTVLGDVETALGRRWRPAVGVGLRWVNLDHFRLGGEILAGWLIQTTEELRRRGFQPEARLRLAAPVGRVAPYMVLGARASLLFDRTVVVSASGEDTSWDLDPRYSLWGTLGVVVAVNQHVGIDIGIDAPWIDIPQITIPGIHLGVMVGGW